MCGRIVQLSLFGSALQAWPEHIRGELGTLTDKYNLCPTQRIAMIVDDAGDMAVRKMRWGIVPPWARDLKMSFSTINARIETVAEKPSFRGAWKAGRRCLVPMQGWYEWREETPPGGKKYKQPYHVAPTGEPTLYAAGLWEPRRSFQPEDEDGSLTVITHDAPARFDLHDRVPVFLSAEQAREWMTASPDDAMAMLLAAPFPEVSVTKVSTRVNSSRNNFGGPEFLEPVD
jgi:putative SOS response-associated peptidase YedK